MEKDEIVWDSCGPTLLRADELPFGELRADVIEAGHIPLLIMNATTGKKGVRHLYSEAYRAKWPKEEFPEKYEEDVPVD